MNFVNSLNQVGSSSNQAFIQSGRQTRTELEIFGEALLRQSRMFKNQHPYEDEDQIQARINEWIREKFPSQATDTADEDTEGSAFYIAKLLEISMTRSLTMAKDYGALQEKYNTAHETFKQETEADQKKIEALKEEKKALTTFLKNTQEKSSSSVTTTSELILAQSELAHLQALCEWVSEALDIAPNEKNKASKAILGSVRPQQYVDVLQSSEEKTKNKDNQTVQTLINILENKERGMLSRCKATFALGEHPELIDDMRFALEAALRDNDEEVKIEAAIALSKHGVLFDVDIPILLRAVKSEKVSVTRRADAAFALCHQPKLTEDIRVALRAALRNNHEEVRISAAVALGGHSALSDADLLILLDGVKNQTVRTISRANAAWALGKQPELTEKIHVALETALRDNDEEVRVDAAVAFSTHNRLSEADIPILLDGIKNQKFSSMFRGNVAFALGNQPKLTENIHLTLKAALRDNDVQVRIQAAVALSTHSVLSNADISILLDGVKNQKVGPLIRANAAWALGEQPELTEKIRVTLEAALRDKSKEVRIQAAIALSLHSALSDADISILLDGVKNQKVYASRRVNAAWALSIQPKLTEDMRLALETALRDSDEGVRIGAAIALSKHRVLSEANTPILLSALQSKNVKATRKANAAYVLLGALSKNKLLSDVEIQLLIDILENKDRHYEAEYRADAAVVLFRQSSLPERARPVLKMAVQDQEREVKVSAAFALGYHFSLSDTVLQILLDIIANKDGRSTAVERGDAAFVLLGQRRSLPERVRPVLERALQDQESRVQINAAVALGYRFPLSDTVLQILLDVIANKEDGRYTGADRANAAVVLFRQSSLPKRVGPILEMALQDQELRVQINAAAALARNFPLSGPVFQILWNVIANKYERYSAEERAQTIDTLLRQSYLPEHVRSALEAALPDQEKEVKVSATSVWYQRFRFPASDL